VIKPASQDAFPLALAAAHDGMQIVVTHSMDHPLGQAVALWTAMRLRQRHGEIVLDGGLQATGLYAPDEFSAQIRAREPRTAPPPGTGFGFDELLAKLPWTLLR
jgi:O-succinylbenzoate synthase